MIKTRKETREIEVVEDEICNKCASSLLDRCGMNFEGLPTVRITGGYASKLGDMNVWEFALCEDCLIELFETFKIDPFVEDSLDCAVYDEPVPLPTPGDDDW